MFKRGSAFGLLHVQTQTHTMKVQLIPSVRKTTLVTISKVLDKK